MVGQVVDELLM